MGTNKNEDNEARDLLSWSTVLTAMLVIGIVVVVILAISSSAPFSVLAASLLVAGSAGAIGVFGGFLFGIPRSVQKEHQKDNAKALGAASEGYAVNTNLEQISDWLTKIIVGVGLVELRRFPDFIERLSTYFVTSFSVQSISGAAVAMIIIYFAVFSFLIGYLWTRLYLTSQFSRADELIKKKPEYYEGVIHAYLYQPMPGGFSQAIRAGESYLQLFGEGNERVWVYMACAYGQQYGYLSRARSPDEAAKKQARDNAYEAVIKALQVDPRSRDLLASLWDPQEAKPGQDDLVVFSGDQDFAKILG